MNKEEDEEGEEYDEECKENEDVEEGGEEERRIRMQTWRLRKKKKRLGYMRKMWRL